VRISFEGVFHAENCRAFDSLAPLAYPLGLPVYVARRPPTPFCETPIAAINSLSMLSRELPFRPYAEANCAKQNT
jgi:hypothetical protein